MERILSEEMNMKKVILMCMQMGKIDQSPARYQLLKELKQNGFKTYLFLPKVKISKEVKNYIDYVIDTKGMSVNQIRKKIEWLQPNSVIATTYEDTRIIYILPWLLKQTSFYYFNLEIYTKEYELQKYSDADIFKGIKWRINYFLNKGKEIIYTRKSRLLVIQDSLRKRVSEKHHIMHKNTILVPNSYEYNETNCAKSKRKGVVYSGGIREDFLGSDIEQICKFKNVSITFIGDILDNQIAYKLKKIQQCNSNIKVKKAILSPKEHAEYLQNFAVGLVLYQLGGDDNLEYIGLSSGKFFKHLSLRQPVIVSDCPGLGREVRKYKLGVVISDLSEIETAYHIIMDNYIFYQRNIERVYKRKYDFGKVISPLIKSMRND